MILAEVLAISVTEVKLDVNEDCHLVMDPVSPDTVKTVLLVPEQTDADPEIDPPTLLVTDALPVVIVCVTAFEEVILIVPDCPSIEAEDKRT